MQELFDLVHEINPTERAVAEAAGGNARSAGVARDYELKARLQSLLVRDHRDELRVAAEADGTISITHRYSNRDACHARLDSLDEEARSWIRWQLDTDEREVEPQRTEAGRRGRAARTERATDDDPLERGRAALAEYDFESAVALFREAVEQSGDREAVRALLEVLVDSLAQDTDALALEADLDEDDVRGDNDICSLLGLAAARVGDLERARRWLDQTTGPRAAEAWVLLAGGALQEASPLDAERAVLAIERNDAAHPSLPQLRAELAACRAAARRPEEEALERVLAAGDEADAYSRAQAILAKWPDSSVAGRTVAAIDERRRMRAVDATCAEARDAQQRGDLVRAKELALRAKALGGEVRDLIAAIDEAADAARVAADDRRVDEVGRWLQDSDERRGLEAYLELEAALRARVKRNAGGAMLSWLDELLPAERTKLRAGIRDAAIDAVIALREAHRLSDAGDHARVLAVLEQHAAIEGVRDARLLRHHAHEAVLAGRQAAALAALEAARSALDAREVAVAARIMGELDRRDLAPPQRALADDVAGQVQREQELAARVALAQEHVTRGELLAARHELDLVLAKYPDHDGHAARGLLEAVRAELRLSWRVRSVECARDPRQLGELVGDFAATSPVPWVSGDGYIVMVGPAGTHVFVAALVVGSERAIVHHVTTPVVLGRYAERWLDGDRIWVIGDRYALQLDWRTGDVTRWETFDAFADDETVREDVMLFPEDRALWLQTRHRRTNAEEVLVIDLDRWSVVRTVTGGRYRVAIPGDEPLVGALAMDSGAVLHTGRGHSASEIIPLRDKRFTSLVRHPTKPGFVAAASPPVDGAELTLYEMVPGRATTALELPGSDNERTSFLVAARARGLVFSYWHGEDGCELAALRTGADGFAWVYRVAAPARIALAHDPASQRAFVIWSSMEGLNVRELDDQPPLFGMTERESSEPVWLPSLAPYFVCNPSKESAISRTVEPLMTAGRWGEVRAQLEGIDVSSLREEERRHHCHVLGLSFARTGDAEKAHEIWTAGLAYDEGAIDCQLEQCIEIVRPLTDDHAGRSDSLVMQIRKAIIESDTCRSRGDARGQLAAVRGSHLHLARERQCLARRADAWLQQLEGDDAALLLEKAHALLQCIDVSRDQSRDLPIVGAWTNERIGDTVTRARQWLVQAGLE